MAAKPLVFITVTSLKFDLY